jgi:hypothetical protein
VEVRISILHAKASWEPGNGGCGQGAQEVGLPFPDKNEEELIDALYFVSWEVHECLAFSVLIFFILLTLSIGKALKTQFSLG